MFKKPEPYTLTNSFSLGFEKGTLITLGANSWGQKPVRWPRVKVVDILDECHCSVRALYWRDYPGIWWNTFWSGCRRVGRFLGYWFDKIFDPMG
jgi:hypothetical protein